MPEPIVDQSDLRPWMRASDVEQRATSRFRDAIRPLRDAALTDDATYRLYIEVIERWYGGPPEEGWHYGYNC